MGENPLIKRGPEAWNQHQVNPLRPLSAGGTTRLLAHAVADNTARQWIPRVRAFLMWARALGRPMSTIRHVDEALAEYFDHMCYSEQCQPWLGTSVMFGLLHVMPEYSGSLYLASRSLRGWRRLPTSVEGGPLCEEAVWVVAIALIASGLLFEGCWVLMQYDSYAREQDMEMLRGPDVTFSSGVVALSFGVSTRGESVKTGTNQGVVLRRAVVGDIALALKNHAVSTDAVRLFPVMQATLRKRWHAAFRPLGMPHARPPHALRHTGPSEDLARSRSSLEAVRRRGRWRSMDSVQRYTKTFALTKFRARMPPALYERGLQIARRLRDAVADALKAAPAMAHPLHAYLTKALQRHACKEFWSEASPTAPSGTLSDSDPEDGWTTD